jgi:hypothetical protein
MERTEEAQVIGAGAEDEGGGPGRVGRFAGSGERQPQHSVLLRVDGDAGAVVFEQARQFRPRRLGQGRGQNRAAGAERDLRPGDVPQVRGERIVEQEADAERAEDVGLSQAERDWHRDQLQDAVRLGEEADGVAAAERAADAGPGREHDRGRRVDASHRQHFAGAVGDQQEGRLELASIVGGNVLNRRRIVGVDRRLQLGRIGDQPGHCHRHLGAGGPEVLDHLAGGGDLAAQAVLGLLGDPTAHEVERGGDREDRQQCAGQEDPVAQRGEQGHRKSKSSSAAPPAGTAAALGSSARPSCHATTL